MKLLVICLILIIIFSIGRLSAFSFQPYTIEDLFEFKGNSITTRYTIRLSLPFLPQVVVPKGTMVAVVEE